MIGGVEGDDYPGPIIATGAVPATTMVHPCSSVIVHSPLFTGRAHAAAINKAPTKAVPQRERMIARDEVPLSPGGRTATHRNKVPNGFKGPGSTEPSNRNAFLKREGKDASMLLQSTLAPTESAPLPQVRQKPAISETSLNPPREALRSVSLPEDRSRVCGVRQNRHAPPKRRFCRRRAACP